MKKNEKNFYSINSNSNLLKPISLKRNKIIYQNYIYKLFRYNQDRRKKTNENNHEINNFNATIKNIYTPRNNKTKQKNFLNINTYENIKKCSMTPKIVKNQNSIKYINNLNISNIISKKNKKNYNKSRNIQNCLNIINTKSNSSLNKLLTNSRINTISTNENNKCLFLIPKSRRIIKNEIINNNSNNYNNYTIFQNKTKINIKRIFSESYKHKTNNNNRNNNINHKTVSPISKNKKNKIKVLLYKEYNDMKPRYRFSKLKKDLILENTKITKMFMKFKTEISKNERLIKYFDLSKINEKARKNSFQI